MDKTILIEKLLNKWLKDEKIENQYISYSIYKPMTPIFSNYDDWKLASNDDYYKEIEETSLVDVEHFVIILRIILMKNMILMNYLKNIQMKKF